LKKLGVVLAAIVLTVGLTIGLAACGSGSSSGKEEGTLKATYASFPDYLDPALSYTQEGWTAMYNTYLPLLTYKHADGVAGSEVVPGLAKDMPKISNGGKTYTLFLQPGLKYSDGSPIKASDFTATVERLFEINSPGSPFYTDIVGAEKFAETKQGGIPGIKADDKTGEIVIDLAKPRGTFVNELGMLFVALLPSDTPSEDLSANPPPASGPYEITKSQPGQGWEYAANPAWTKTNAKLVPEVPSGHFEKIDVTIVRNASTQVNDVEQGKYEWMQSSPPADRYAEIKSKYEGTQFRVEPSINTYYFWMNTSEPPFDDVKVRQAVNHAVNQEALERIYSGTLAGTQQILPPGMPAYEKFELYPYDVAKAKAMLKEANPADMDITVWTDNESPNKEAGEYYDGILKEIGFDTTLKILNADNYFTVIGNLTTPNVDTGWGNWFQDYPNPNDFFQPLLTTGSIAPTNNSNLAQFSNPELDRKVAELAEEELGPEQEAAYEDLDREFMEEAPWAPYGNRTLTTFVSGDIDLDKVISNPTFGQDLTSFQYK
jgi:peptide/nickel transport system substrate-binding protein